MTLSDRTIKEEIKKGNIIIDPFSPNDVQPASVDLHLTNKILIFNNSSAPYIDLMKDIPNLVNQTEIIYMGDS